MQMQFHLSFKDGSSELLLSSLGVQLDPYSGMKLMFSHGRFQN